MPPIEEDIPLRYPKPDNKNYRNLKDLYLRRLEDTSGLVNLGSTPDQEFNHASLGRFAARSNYENCIGMGLQAEADRILKRKGLTAESFAKK